MTWATTPSVGTWLLFPFSNAGRQSECTLGRNASGPSTDVTTNAKWRYLTQAQYVDSSQGTRDRSKTSLAFRSVVKPTNLLEAKQAFFASNFSVAPKFSYAFSDESVRESFLANSNISVELLSDAERILKRGKIDRLGETTSYLNVPRSEICTAEELCDEIYKYLRQLQIEDKVDLVIVDNALCIASVSRPSSNENFIVKIQRGTYARAKVQGICDHEIGTHLLRMLNDEFQVWHNNRLRYKLSDPWTTEEGLATLNTYRSSTNKLMFPQALSYFAVCRGASVGFVDLFRELREWETDLDRCWLMCCRVKRGMLDTSLPGALYIDQSYFRGAVEILQHIYEIDFRRLYSGQLALQDLEKVHYLTRRTGLRMPLFLNSSEKLSVYADHCYELIRENQIEVAVHRVWKPATLTTCVGAFTDVLMVPSRNCSKREAIEEKTSGSVTKPERLGKRTGAIIVQPAVPSTRIEKSRSNDAWMASTGRDDSRVHLTLQGPDLDTIIRLGDITLPPAVQSLNLRNLGKCMALTLENVASLGNVIPCTLLELTVDFRFCWTVTDPVLHSLAAMFPRSLSSLNLRNMGSCGLLTDTGFIDLLSSLPSSLESLDLDFSRSKNLTDKTIAAATGCVHSRLRSVRISFKDCVLATNAGFASIARSCAEGTVFIS